MGFQEIIASINWEDESYPAYEDFAVLPFLVVFFPTVRFLLGRFVFEGITRRLVLGKEPIKAGAETDGTRKTLTKFKESAWKFVYFLSSEALALSVTYNEPWFTSTRNYWIGPGEQVWPDQKIKLKLKGLYMYAAGFYTYSIFALLFWETRRSDFGCRCPIIWQQFARVGSMVLALHDATDVFLETAKMSKYSGYDMLASIMFVLFALAWIIFRLIYFPFGSSTAHGNHKSILTIDKDKHVEGPMYYYVFNSLLFTLFFLHVYWWVLIFRMLVKQIKSRGQIGDDVRSDSEDEDEHED
ncbi:unnamed protein product [Spirodela intermedia]|uniref:TLC domain-containing protein n=1 Tax=Spirodela intermedia TaxID=51605 RepID=A0A7I8JQR8_SPIIN|nr:unnamed protein product [Spirodela intermedia]CAA6672476.1 unnamed protein product [Spirodela intermedia]